MMRAMRIATFPFVMAVSWVVLNCASAQAQFSVPALYADHMVLLADSDITIKGTDKPGQVVVVDAQWGAKITATADAAGVWRATLHTSAKAGPWELRFKGSEERVLRDVLCGEVWLCGGQSNMEWTLGPGVGKGTANYQAEVAAAAHPNIRLFDVPNVTGAAPQATVTGNWELGDGPQVSKWSAVAWHFAKEVQAATKRPVGLIVSAWGGTPAESWASAVALRRHGGFDDTLDALAAADASKKPGPNTPSALWNGMIAPLLPYAIRGAIFYQGESNIGRWEQYRTLFPAMIADWRAGFGDIPFLFVQIAPFSYGKDKGEAARLREAQYFTSERVANCAMAVTMDIGDAGDIHPLNKQDVGRRLAAAALVKAYGKEMPWRGPRYMSGEAAGEGTGGEFVLHMDSGGSALQARDGLPLTCFSIAGEDRVFHAAVARISGTTLRVSAVAVPSPVAVRFAFGAADQPNLRNAAGFPASSFRTDDWPLQ